MEYKKSIAHHTVMSSSMECLLIRVRYTKMAINTHKEENNNNQVQFFTEELNLINKMLNKKK